MKKSKKEIKKKRNQLRNTLFYKFYNISYSFTISINSTSNFKGEKGFITAPA